MSPNLEEITVGSTNISSRVAFGAAHTVAADGILAISAVMTALNGAAATLTVDVEIVRSALAYGGPRYSWSKRSVTSVRELTPDPLIVRVKASDSVQVYLTSSNASDTAVSGTVYVDDALRKNADVIQISGDATAADNAEAFFDGTGYAGTNNVIPTVTTLTNKSGFSLSALQTFDQTGTVGGISGITFPTNFDALAINASGHISRVTLVDTTTTNTDMRGTDSAALAATALSNATWTDAKAAFIDAAISDIPTTAEGGLTTAQNTKLTDIHEIVQAGK